ncbi:discoidin domain-containing protein [Paenibacillus sp. GXUN7292]|uniref:discoidin domain-containing protein n=1 Tax=Paenibacillus sp. GXUN7292 TaxID=3422499 RepID=UPI003D7DF219
MRCSRIFLIMFIVIAFCMPSIAPVQAEAADVNLALNKPAVASSTEHDNGVPWPHLLPEKAVDGSASSRWSADRTDDEWFYVDLGESMTVSRVVINWLTDAMAEKFKIQVSNDKETWTNVYADDRELKASASGKDTLEFEPVQAQYVKFQGIKRTSQFGYSFFEFEVYEKHVKKPANVNLALNKPAVASSTEHDNGVPWPHLLPGKAVDGNASSRWSADRNDNEWFYVDLGESMTVSRVVINWHVPAVAEKYKLQVSNDAQTWTNVFAGETELTASSSGKDIIEFEPVQARYVKFQGVKRASQYGYSIYEFEVYEKHNLLPALLKKIQDEAVVTSDQTVFQFPELDEGYTASLISTDNLQVIDADGNIHKPLVSQLVQLYFKLESTNDASYFAMANAAVLVPGQYEQQPDSNPEPRVIPSLREWLGGQGKLTLTAQSKIVIDLASEGQLRDMAEIWAQELAETTKLNLAVEAGLPQSGDIYLTFDNNQEVLGKEGYLLEIKEYATIRSAHYEGLFYGTRTVLQLLAGSESGHDMPQGLTRDYPKFADRGFMLDVARKFYTIEFLQDYVKLMSYYKMNRFQIHLNDDVGGTGKFRLESEIFDGLASDDGYYTKDEFRNLQKLGMDYAVNVVPEIDTPGHSGVFIAYDDKLGTGSQLDIESTYAQEFIKKLFSEYMDDPNPTFIGPEVHVGTDEYAGTNKEAFRSYMNLLIEHVSDSGKKPRVWGNLTKFNGDTKVNTSAIMDIWYEVDGSAKDAVEQGFDIINVNTNLLYIVPQLYSNYLNYEYLYNKWEANDWVENKLPDGHPQVKGGMFALWNDVSVEKGVSMADTHQRVLPSMQIVSEKLWAGTRADGDLAAFQADAAKHLDPPGTHLSHRMPQLNERNELFVYDFEEDYTDQSGNGFDGTAANVDIVEGMQGKAAALKGGSSYIETGLRSVGFGWTMSMWMKPDKDNAANAVLLESQDGQLVYNIDGTGKIGFKKEGYRSTFNYKIEPGQWTHIIMTGDDTGTSIFINGSEFAVTLKDGSKLDTLVLPVASIGSSENAFKGLVDEIVVMNKFIDFHGNLALHKSASSSEIESSAYSADKAVDGKGNTRWSSAWRDEAWFMVDLGEVIEVDTVSIIWQSAFASEYKILVSTDGNNWTNVVPSNNGIERGKRGRVVTSFKSTPARYVKFEGIRRDTIFGYSFEEFEVFSENNKLGNKKPILNLINQIADSQLNEANFSEEGWKALQAAIVKAQAAVLSITLTKPVADELLGELQAARDYLTLEEIRELITLNIKEAITKNVALPQKGAQGTRIVWSSSHPDYLNANGQLLKRPSKSQGDLQVKLTATIVKGNAEIKKDFLITIKALDGTPWYPNPSTGGNNGGGSGSDNGNGSSGEGNGSGNNGGGSEPGEGSGNNNGGNSGGGSSQGSFTDTVNHWAAPSIEKAVKAGFIKGYGNGQFKPDKTVSRSEFAAMLARALKLEDSSVLSFKDEADIPNWAKADIAKMLAAGIVSGYDDQTFRPAAQITRTELSVMAVRALGLPLKDGSSLTFADAEQIPHWAKAYVQAAFEAEIMNGRSNNSFAPTATATRAEAAVIVLRIMETMDTNK